jgi:hypothetical protein
MDIHWLVSNSPYGAQDPLHILLNPLDTSTPCPLRTFYKIHHHEILVLHAKGNATYPDYQQARCVAAWKRHHIPMQISYKLAFGFG